MGQESFSIDDAELVRRCNDNDERAWRLFFDRYYPLIRSIACTSWHWSADEAEDIAQEAFIQIVQALRQYKGTGSLRNFVLQTARRASLDQLDKRRAKCRRAERMTEAVESLEALGAVHAVEPQVRTRLAAEELLDRLRRYLDGLGEPCTSLLRMRFRDQLGYEELAAVRSAPLGTIATHLRRCLQRLIEVTQGLEADEQVLEQVRIEMEREL